MTNVIIIGAPRSGTNMLRDVLTSVDGVGTWPCDEINYIWRHGNVRYPTDEFPERLASPRVARYIQRAFESLGRRRQLDVVVEKTCANCLRIPFVDRVVPGARYIYIHRDGVDATGSGLLRWKADLDLAYIMAKARYVPPVDLPYYAARYLFSHAYRLTSRDRRVASWGPVFEGMPELLRERSLNEVCALQWQRCVELAEQGLEGIDPSRVFRVRYEDFVGAPAPMLEEMCAFIGVPFRGRAIPAALSRISRTSVGKGRAALGAQEVARLENLVGSTLGRYHYL